MPKYILKRIVGTIPTLIIVVTFVFFFVRLIPGDPARLVAGEQATQDDVEAVREELGLNKSIPTQYVTYVTGLLKGNLGTSLRTKQPVTKEIAGRFGNTVRLAFVTLLWSSVVGVLFGVWSGTHRGKWQDYTGMTIAVSGISLPSFWIGFLLIMLFAVKLRILPTTSGTSLKSLIMPSITLGVGIVTETVFAYPGLGSLLIESVNYRDYPAIQSLILIFSLQFIVINLIVDILYAVLNPEIKLQ